jgi:hypothetical protein
MIVRMMFLKLRDIFSKTGKQGYFILLDMLISLTISSFCLMMVFSELHRIQVYNRHIEEIILQRNQVTKVLTSKQHYVQENNLEKDRSYEIFPGVFVDIYQIKFDKQIYELYGLEEVEFGIVDKRKGE